jgi:hypothetical protein
LHLRPALRAGQNADLPTVRAEDAHAVIRRLPERPLPAPGLNAAIALRVENGWGLQKARAAVPVGSSTEAVLAPSEPSGRIACP